MQYASLYKEYSNLGSANANKATHNPPLMTSITQHLPWYVNGQKNCVSAHVALCSWGGSYS